MFCGKCGASVPDGAVVCPACGAPTGAAPTPGSKKPSKKLIAGIVGVVVLIALVIVLISSCGGGSPESMAEDYFDALFSGTGEDMWDAVNMDAFMDLLIEAGEIDEDDADFLKDYEIESNDQLCEWYQDACEEAYGRDWSYEIEVTKVKDLSNSKLRDLESYINDEDTDFEVTEGVAVTVKVTLTGDEDDFVEKFTIIFYKVDGEWIVHTRSLYYYH